MSCWIFHLSMVKNFWLDLNVISLNLRVRFFLDKTTFGRYFQYNDNHKKYFLLSIICEFEFCFYNNFSFICSFWKIKCNIESQIHFGIHIQKGTYISYTIALLAVECEILIATFLFNNFLFLIQLKIRVELWAMYPRQ